MLRKVFLVGMATVVSFSLTGLSGYVLYTLSQGRSEAQVSVLVRFVFSPGIALVVGGLVGFLSNDYPALMSIVCLSPWALIIHGSSGGCVTPNWLVRVGPVLIYLALGSIAGVFAFRLRHRHDFVTQ
jgi:hypothetical protein